MQPHPRCGRPRAPERRSVCAAVSLALLAACGGSDDPPTYTNGALSAGEIETAQTSLEPNGVAAADAASVLSATQIETRQRTAVDRAAITETASIEQKQAALDADESLTPAF